jgi:hypothetical protein
LEISGYWIQNIGIAFFEETNSQYLRIFGLELPKNLNDICSLENIYDNIRHIFIKQIIAYGTRGTSIKFILLSILKSTNTIATGQLICSLCNHQCRVVGNNQAFVIHAINNMTGLTTINWVNNIQGPSCHNCPNCSINMVRQTMFSNIPNILAFDIYKQGVTINNKIVIKNNKSKILYLKGIISSNQMV